MIRHCLPTCRDHLRLQHLFSTAALRAVKDLTGPSAGKTSSQEYAWRGCWFSFYDLVRIPPGLSQLLQ